MIGIIVFISIFSSIFGSDNTLIGVVIITAILMFSSMKLSLEFKDAILGIVVFFSAMGITSYFVKSAILQWYKREDWTKISWDSDWSNNIYNII